MSEVVRERKQLVRVGCLGGPNLAAEIMAGQPAATLVGSRLGMIQAGQTTLNSAKFRIRLLGHHGRAGWRFEKHCRTWLRHYWWTWPGQKHAGLTLQWLGWKWFISANHWVPKVRLYCGLALVIWQPPHQYETADYAFGTRLAGWNGKIRNAMPELAEGTLRIAHQPHRHLQTRTYYRYVACHSISSVTRWESARNTSWPILCSGCRFLIGKLRAATFLRVPFLL